MRICHSHGSCCESTPLILHFHVNCNCHATMPAETAGHTQFTLSPPPSHRRPSAKSNGSQATYILLSPPPSLIAGTPARQRKRRPCSCAPSPLFSPTARISPLTPAAPPTSATAAASTATGPAILPPSSAPRYSIATALHSRTPQCHPQSPCTPHARPGPQQPPPT